MATGQKQHFLVLLIGHKAGSFTTIVSSSAQCFQTPEIMDNIYQNFLVIQWLRLSVQGHSGSIHKVGNLRSHMLGQHSQL